MNIKLIGDSCLDYIEGENFYTRVPFNIDVEGVTYVDENLDTHMLLQKMSESKNGIKTSCPAPNLFYDLFEEDKDNYVVCISSKLSGSYNSAIAAKDMFLEEHPNTNIEIFDSKSAACGENLIMLKIKELTDKNLPFKEVVKTVNEYISSVRTYFILNSYDNLVKNGRMKSIVAKGAQILHIVPVMGENGEGEIMLKHLARGTKNAYKKIIEAIATSKENISDRILSITHVEAPQIALTLKEKIKERFNFKDVRVYKGSGLSCAYADVGGIILTF